MSFNLGSTVIPSDQRDALLQQATSGTMVPPELLGALITQESGWDPTRQRAGGTDLGLGQITASTGAAPGYGMSPISRADATDPIKNAAWAARYLEARGKSLGLLTAADWKDPQKVSLALKAYNGGGDPNYVQNVFGSGGPLKDDPGQVGANGATPSLQMPSDRPTPTLPDAPTARGPSETAQVAEKAPGTDLMTVGMALMGGARDGTGFSDASRAMQTIQQQDQQRAIQQAQFRNDAINRDTAEPYKAFDAANQRAQLQATLRGQDITSDTSRLNAQERMQATIEAAKLRAQYQEQWHEQQSQMNKSSTRYVVPGSDPSSDQPYVVTMSRDGSMQVLDGRTNKPVDSNALPDGAVPEADFRKQLDENRKTNNPLITKMAQDASAGREQNERFDTALTALNNPKANTQPGILGSFGRALDAATGLNLTGNLSDEQIADGMLKQDMLGQFGKAAGGGQRVTDSLRSFIQTAQPHLGQDPDAIRTMTQFLRQQSNMRVRLSDAWSALPQTDQDKIKNRGNVAQWMDQTRKGLMDQDASLLDNTRNVLTQRYGNTPQGGPTGAPGGGNPARRPIDAFVGGGIPAPTAPTGAPPSPYAVPGGQNLQPMRSYAMPPGSGGDGAPPPPAQPQQAPQQAPQQPPPQAAEGGFQPGQAAVATPQIRDPMLYQQALRSQATQLLRENPGRLGYPDAVKIAAQRLGPPPEGSN